MSEPYPFNLQESFNEFDTNLDGVLSLNELRNLASKIYDLPITPTVMDTLQMTLYNCSQLALLNETLYSNSSLSEQPNSSVLSAASAPFAKLDAFLATFASSSNSNRTLSSEERIEAIIKAKHSARANQSTASSALAPSPPTLSQTPSLSENFTGANNPNDTDYSKAITVSMLGPPITIKTIEQCPSILRKVTESVHKRSKYK